MNKIEIIKKKINVIKFGGEIVESPSSLENLAHSIRSLHNSGEAIILIHGGGPQATNLSAKLGQESIMVGGRRVTDKNTLEVMKMTLSGTVHCELLSLLRKFNLPGMSLNGISFIHSQKRPPKKVSGSDQVVDFGFVGDIVSIDINPICYLLAGNFIPVISPLTADDGGQILNINADTVSVQIAKEIKASKFISVTKIGGVYLDINDPASRISTLTVAEAKNKISQGIIKGGMIPKIEEGFELLQGHLSSFHIVGPDSQNGIQKEIDYPGSIGTAILK